MVLVRRQLLVLAAFASGLPAALHAARAQGGPKLTPILRGDLVGQSEKVQETVVNSLELGPGIGAPWHMHPGAQELLYVLDGSILVEMEGQGAKTLKAGEIVLIPAEIPHLARNESTSGTARGLVVHSRGDKEKPFVVPVKRST